MVPALSLAHVHSNARASIDTDTYITHELIRTVAHNLQPPSQSPHVSRVSIGELD